MPSDEAKKAALLFAQDCRMVSAASAPEHFPKTKMVEIAFAGRSNVGKSSLINALVGRKNLARASNTPGRTQQIFFYDLVQRLMLVDLPGYGYAAASRVERENWDELVRHYVQNRPQLRCVCLLVDSRHGAHKGDLAMMQFLDRAAVSYKIVLTKIDKVPVMERDARRRQMEAMLSKHPAARTTALSTSAERGIGIEETREFLAGFAFGS
jgi:GTP-binding protein